ncbi:MULTISPECIES: glycosyltransferase family protein [Kocuria]|uniref:glycosyltransferase family 2 protein n=1 Tax=Kocuria TaxID=57493 RepID=UPI00203D8918|nr:MULTISPECIES: glycosyltransferase family 2 protein [Kocuria]MCM3686794.1 glycosyltransferase family 2 protein [Kocuria rosea]HST71817.1 glycosyltransferase family 2 protein [Kocuria rosea]
MPSDPTPTVAVACVTQDRPEDVLALVAALRAQTAPVAALCLVDAGREPVPHERLAEAVGGCFELHHVRSRANLGGAGGFALAILTALATGAEQVWLMDDDAHPEGPGTLAVLLEESERRGLAVVSPIVVAPQDHDRLAFAHRVAGRLTHDRAAVETLGFVPSHANFFNGALMREHVFFRVGLPDLKLFLRGDEVDFLIRLRASGLPFGTTTRTAVAHPPAWGEEQVVVPGRLQVVVPETEFKRAHFFRNRGWTTWHYRRVVQLGADLVGYPLYYLGRRDPRGLASWAGRYVGGMRGRGFGGPR